MRRTRFLVVAVVTVIAVGGWLAWHRWSNSTTPIGVDELARQVAASTTPTTSTTEPTPTTASATAEPATTTTTTATTTHTTPPPSLPQTGVYAFETSGTESLDVLDGVERTYPAETGMVVSSTPCGIDLRWQPYVERSYTISLCAGASGLELVGYANHYEFYGDAERRRLACDRPMPWQASPHAALEAVCDGDGLTEQRRAAASSTSLTIGDRQRTVTHLVVDTQTTGSTEGTTHEELWIDATTGMLLRLERTVANTSDTPVGNAHYQETVALSLSALAPVDAHAGLRDRREH